MLIGAGKIKTRENGEIKLQELRTTMWITYCPLIRGCCNSACIHFDSGKVFEWNDSFRLVKPKCKLWKD